MNFLNKLKKIWQENKVLFVLGLILIVCLIIIGIIAIKSFYSSCDDAYCNRRVEELRENLPSEIKNKLKENKDIISSSVTVKNAIVYISATFNDATKLDNAKKAMEVIIPLFSEEELLIYDLDLTIKTEDINKGFILKGARNTNGNGTIIWSNKTESSEKE